MKIDAYQCDGSRSVCCLIFWWDEQHMLSHFEIKRTLIAFIDFDPNNMCLCGWVLNLFKVQLYSWKCWGGST